MSSERVLGPGGSTLFTTRPVGMSTRLFAITNVEEAGPDDLAEFIWHIELCCQPDHSRYAPIDIDISAAAGALVTVRNVSVYRIKVWTDYI